MLFNSPIETGLRALVMLTEDFPNYSSLQKIVVFDYLLVHSDDIPDGPPGLHPKTPYRSGELLVRRSILQEGILLYQSRGLIERCFDQTGLYYQATEHSASFLDVLDTSYSKSLRSRAQWLIQNFGSQTDTELDHFARNHLGKWGAEFVMESVLWAKDDK